MTVRLDAVLDAARRDAEAGLLDAWSDSTVVDEHVGTAVVPRGIVDVLHDAAGLERRFPIGNAGLLHVYGYWFSDVVTPFGMKRDRWLDGQLATALGLAPDAFLLTRHAVDGEPTLLARITSAVLPLLRAPSADADVVEHDVGGLRTRVVLHRAPGASATALVYGVDAGDGLRLVTAFPVGDPRLLLEDVAAEPRLRWNAVVPARP